MHAGTGALESVEDLQALGRLQEQAEGKTPGHDDGNDPRHARRFEVEAVAVEDHADNRPEHDQRNQAGKNRLDQTFFDIDGFFSGCRHRLHLRHKRTAQQALRPEDQYEDEQRETEHVFVVGVDQTGEQRLGDTEDDPAEHGAWQ